MRHAPWWSLFRRRTGALTAGAIALGVLAAGCWTPYGPDLGPVDGAGALIRSVREKAGRVKRLYSSGGGMRYKGPYKGKVRSFPLRADFFLGEEDGFRLEIRHPLSSNLLFMIVLNEGDFLLADYLNNKGYEGDAMEVISDRFPELGLRPGDLSAWHLFLPTIEPRSGERVSLARVGRTYVLEFWEPDHVPTRQVWVDSWSHTPTRSVFYRKDGSVASEFTWGSFTWREEERLVLPRRVDIRLTAPERRIRLVLASPQVNVKFNEQRAFDLRLVRQPLFSRGIEIEEIRPGADRGSGKASEEEAVGASAGRTPEE